MRGTRLVLGVLVLAATVAVLSLSTDFQAASSASDLHSSVAKFTLGAPPTATLQPGSPILLVVCGDNDLHTYLEKELVQQLGSSTGNRAAALSCSVPDETSGPALWVETSREKFTWTPAYASAGVVARLAYASDGDLKWKDDATVVMGRKDGLSQVRVRGELVLKDTTQGVISRPAYYRHLSRQIALAVSGTVRRQIND